MVKSAILALACALVAGCSIFERDEARVGIQAYLPDPFRIEWLKVTVEENGRRHQVEARDYERFGTQYNGPTFETRTSGTLRVSYVLTHPTGGEISSGLVELDLRADWGWGVTIHADTANPERMCFGCIGSRAFALAPAFRIPAADSVYVVWGGNSIKNPVIY